MRSAARRGGTPAAALLAGGLSWHGRTCSCCPPVREDATSLAPAPSAPPIRCTEYTVLSGVLLQLGYTADHGGDLPGVATIRRGETTWRGTAIACWAWLVHTGQIEWSGPMGAGMIEELERLRDRGARHGER